MKKLITIITLLIVILASILIFITVKNPYILTGKITSNPDIEIYSYTKAICNENNFCQDYYIKCNGKQVQDMSPIKNAYVQYPQDWNDPREKRKLCHRN